MFHAFQMHAYMLNVGLKTFMKHKESLEVIFVSFCFPRKVDGDLCFQAPERSKKKKVHKSIMIGMHVTLRRAILNYSLIIFPSEAPLKCVCIQLKCH